jgi:Diacylglycerol kinase catalytic domain
MRMRLGLIRNSHSRRNRRGGDTFRLQAAHTLGSLFVEPASHIEMEAALREMARQEVGLIAIDGGDGTVRDVMSALPEAFGDTLPALAILPSGNTNLIAADIGFGARGTQALNRLLRDAAADTLGHQARRRHSLAVRWNDGSHPPLLGMFCGAAAFTKGITLAHEPRFRERFSHRTAVALAIASSVGKVLCGSTREAWLAGEPMSVAAGQANGAQENHFLFLATTLHRLMLGLWPFWAADENGIRYLDITAHPHRLLAASWALLRGRVPAWVQQSEHYRSGSAAQISLHMSHDFVLDGEVFTPGRDGMVHLSLGPAFDFVHV